MTKQAGQLYTLWAIICSLYYTGLTGLKAITRAMFGSIDRKWVDHTILVWTKKILGLAKVNYRIVNPHQVTPPKDRAIILMCNHTSLYDIPLSYLAFPDHSIRMLAKKELSRVPLMGGGMKASEFPLIDRHNKQQAIEDLKQVKKLLESGIIMWIAPEGTRSKSGKLGPFKKGGFITAIQAKAVIIPIGIRGADQICPPRTFKLNLYQNAEVHIGQPIDSSNYSLEQKDKLIDTVRKSMLSLVGES